MENNEPAEWLSKQAGEGMLRDQNTEALALFTQAMLKEPKNPKHLVDIGRVRIKLCHYAEAEQVLLEALTILPSSTEALLALANCFAGQGKHEEAIRVYDRLLNPASTLADFILLSKALSCFQVSRFPDGLSAINRCLELNPTMPYARDIKVNAEETMQLGKRARQEITCWHDDADGVVHGSKAVPAPGLGMSGTLSLTATLTSGLGLLERLKSIVTPGSWNSRAGYSCDIRSACSPIHKQNTVRANTIDEAKTMAEDVWETQVTATAMIFKGMCFDK